MFRLRAALCAALLMPTTLLAQVDDDEWLDQCRSQNRGDDRERACEVRVETIPARATLRVDPGRNGGAYVEAYNGREIEVHARLQARAGTRAEAAELLREVRLDLGNQITADGPENNRDANWFVNFVILVPRNTNLRIRTENGPIGVRGVRGDIDIEAVNGPLSLDAVAGNVRARTLNGPIQVDLEGARWEGAGLDAETQNGPIHVIIPDDYSAELETGTVNGPMDVRLPLTVTLQGQRWKRINTTLGSGGPPVRVVTTNGPVKLSRP